MLITSGSVPGGGHRRLSPFEQPWGGGPSDAGAARAPSCHWAWEGGMRPSQEPHLPFPPHYPTLLRGVPGLCLHPGLCHTAGLSPGPISREITPTCGSTLTSSSPSCSPVHLGWLTAAFAAFSFSKESSCSLPEPATIWSPLVSPVKKKKKASWPTPSQFHSLFHLVLPPPCQPHREFQNSRLPF